MKDWIIRYWAEAVFAVVTAALTWCYRRLARRVTDKAAEDAAIKEGLLAMLHDRLYNECTSRISDGCVGVDELRNIEYLYNAYHALGGNGTGTELYNRVKALEIGDGS